MLFISVEHPVTIFRLTVKSFDILHFPKVSNGLRQARANIWTHGPKLVLKLKRGADRWSVCVI